MDGQREVREKEDILSRGRVQCGMQLKLENHTGNAEAGNPAWCQSMESGLQRVGHRGEGVCEMGRAV